MAKKWSNWFCRLREFLSVNELVFLTPWKSLSEMDAANVINASRL